MESTLYHLALIVMYVGVKLMLHLVTGGAEFAIGIAAVLAIEMTINKLKKIRLNQLCVKRIILYICLTFLRADKAKDF